MLLINLFWLCLTLVTGLSGIREHRYDQP